MEWYLKVLKQFADFEGRARRKEYWMFALFNFIIFMVLAFIDGLLGLFDFAAGIGILTGIYSLFIIIPSIAVTVRRLHDTGKTGWTILVSLIPIIGFIWLLVLMVTEGDRGINRYGSNPKES